MSAMKKRKVPMADESSSSEDDVPISKRLKMNTPGGGAKAASKTKAATSSVISAGIHHEDEYLWVVVTEGSKPSQKVAAFDIDGTIVSPKSVKKNGKPNKFPQTRSDWRFYHPVNHLHASHKQKTRIAEKLRKLHSNGVRIVFFTNQAGILKGKQKCSDITGKIQDLAKNIGVPITGFIAGGKDRWRKPNTDMWTHFVRKFNGGSVDMKNCIYVGDAAGREKRKDKFDRPRDFSCSDRKYAKNIGIRFATPEAFFYGEKEAPFVWRSLNPAEWLKEAVKRPLYPGKTPTFPAPQQELIIMVGFPASGKTTFAKKHLEKHGYVWINRDTLSTVSKCKKALTDALKSGKSAVVDNTNPTIKTRQDWLNIANKLGVPSRCLVMTSSKEEVKHFNFFRQKKGGPKVPEIAINVFNKKYEKPSKSEGFTKLYFVNFVPKFDSKEDEKLFRQHN